DMQFVIPDDGTGNPLPDLYLYGTATHMHYVGTDMRITVERASQKNGDPATECLIEEPAWDFNWQRFYAYDTEIEKLPELHTGDTVKLHCSYDNTLENPFVAQALMQQHLTAPHAVKLGETTLDEMCLGGFVFLVKL
ncbi:MAG TPA: hypothetical protein VHB21_25770, partial [Minicystis sp.]|nr:hypothetical protein [Minicystis sp.]